VRAEDLLRHYPNITADEVKELVEFLTRGPIIERGTLSGQEHLQTQLTLLRADHAAEFRMNHREYAIFMVIVAAFLGVCALMWDVAAK
jgi:hypothetical protein